MTKTTKARKHSSLKLQELINEITPVEMEQTKVKMQFAAHLEDLLQSKGWGKSEFAKKVGKEPSDITRWLSGTQNLTLDVLTEIAFALGVEVSSLFGKQPVQVVFRKEVIVTSKGLCTSNYPFTPIEKDSDRDTVYNFKHFSTQKILA